MKKRIMAFVLTAVLIMSLPNCFSFSYSAKSMAVLETATGTFIESVSGDVRLPMASTTKIMTALVTLENANLQDTVNVPSVAVGVEGSSLYLANGEKLTVYELVVGLMLTSGNDAAMALAHFVGKGDINAFVKMMNSYAQKIGLSNTNFVNPSGLPDDNHYTTAKELAIITSVALQNEVFAKIVSMKTAKISKNGVKDARILTNHNKLLWLYDGAVGVKTGFTKKAGRCLVSAAKRDGVTLVCVTLCDRDDWNDHTKALDKGFERCKYTLLCDENEVVCTLNCPDGTKATATNNHKLETVVIDGKMPLKQIYAPKFVYAPMQKGDLVGKVSFYLDGKEIATSQLCLISDIEVEIQKELFITKIIKLVRNIFKWNNS